MCVCMFGCVHAYVYVCVRVCMRMCLRPPLISYKCFVEVIEGTEKKRKRKK